MEFVIKTTWDGKPLAEVNWVKFTFEDKLSSNGEVVLKFEAPFYEDPAPDSPPGPLFRLWDYEVVEVFILGDKNRYLELEFGPHGHHLVLLLDGVHNVKVHSIDIKYEWSTEDWKWMGKTFIPKEYFPKGASKLNCYHIHGQGEQRTYSSLFPVETGKYKEPEFHRLEYFKKCDFKKIIPGINKTTSSLWENTLKS